ncbi:MAG: hypothetical protein IT306_21490 [Chloroflexi bacterium]|nr:hypothetical protein [Chloroflexota bacterium]
MEGIERTASVDTPDVTPATATTAATPADAASPPPAPTQELLCTICNLRACWEAPAAP